jgi:hypothetical protein
MGRFYFHLKDGEEIFHDDEGAEFPDVDAAKQEAEHSAREFLCEALKTRKPRVPGAFVIADEAGRTLYVLPLAAVLPEPLKK